MSETINLEQCVLDARTAALAAWREIHHFYRGEYEVYEKPDGPATEADIRADETILGYLKERYPTSDFGYLSEELAKDHERTEKAYCWIIDPIDGTRDFIEGREDFAVQIALVGPVVPDGPSVPLAAALYMPAQGIMYTAQHKEGTYEEIIPGDFVNNSNSLPEPRDLNRISVSSHSEVKTCRSVVTRQNQSKKLQSVIDHLCIAKIENRGSFGVKVAEVATGRADVYLNTAHRRCKEWDVCAPHLILEEAGGMLTDLQGQQITYNKDDVFVGYGVVASNSLLHASIIERLKEIEDVWS